jgi:alkylation response protein AidB-like acyl-CoA dehydrogenase
MLTYRAPLADFAFLLRHVFDHDGVVAALPPYADATADTVAAVLEEAAAFAEGVLLPLNRAGDEQGCAFADGAVHTPEGFRDAYAALVAGGWNGIGVAPEQGGAGLPAVVATGFEEMICSANLAFATYPLLSAGAAAALTAHASPEQIERFVPGLASGEWCGTMCLTEAHAGTDLGLLRTRAEPRDDGTYRISGTKVFITGGDHDLTDQIVHLVLARLPDAPPGTAGISLFVVPKRRPDGGRNGVTCGSLEHKMGIRGSATCVLHFEDAAGELVGAAHGGMAQMFTMMNRARLGVGIQGVGIGEVAYQTAVAYARERLQGRAPGRPHGDGAGPDPIIAHPDVRRALLRMRALTEAGRALATWIAVEMDVSHHHPDPVRREAAGDLVALLTPIVKAACTDNGVEAANLAIAVHGGAGYISESGVEQLARDARISQIYEGTNGVQALDLVGRKLPMHHGRLLRRFFHPAVKRAAGPHPAEVAGVAEAAGEAIAHLQETTIWLGAAGGDREQAAAAATDYLRLFALTAFADLWLRMAAACVAAPEGLDAGLAERKLATARFYAERMLPEAGALARAVRSGKASITAIADDAF